MARAQGEGLLYSNFGLAGLRPNEKQTAHALAFEKQGMSLN